MSRTTPVEFVGGPLDGRREMQPDDLAPILRYAGDRWWMWVYAGWTADQLAARFVLSNHPAGSRR